MVSIRSGLLGSLFATFAISAIVQMKKATGSLPDVHLLNAWSTLFGEPSDLAVGWIAHLVVSIIVGGIGFALFVECLVLVADIVKIAEGKYE